MNDPKLALKEFIIKSGQQVLHIVKDNSNSFEEYFDSRILCSLRSTFGRSSTWRKQQISTGILFISDVSLLLNSFGVDGSGSKSPLVGPVFL